MPQRDTYDTSLLRNPLVVLRKVDFSKMDDATIEIIGDAQLAFRYPERNLVWFAGGYVLNDQPRLAEVSKELIAATQHFAIGRTDSMSIMADDLELKQAEKAVRGAKISLDLNVELEDEKPSRSFKAEDDGLTEADSLADLAGEPRPDHPTVDGFSAPAS